MITGKFLTIFGINSEHETTRKVAVEAVRNGFAVVPLPPGSKKPTICTLTARELRASGPGHRCGVHHAITTDKDVNRIFTRLERTYGPDMGLGIVAYPSRVVVVDADQRGEVGAFQDEWRRQEGTEITPTVLTPGMVGDGDQWLHKDGGHFYLSLPDGVELGLGRGYLKDESGYVIRWGWSMTAVPPTRRKEGPYLARGNIVEAPGWLVARIAQDVETQQRRISERGETYANDAIAQWSARHSWESLLVPDGWTATSKSDRCGCPIFEKPGGGSTSYKSATGHEDTCAMWENVERHGPLHLWTTDPPSPLADWMRDSGKTSLTKLTYVAVTHHDGDMGAARVALGLAPGLDEWLSPDGPDAGRQDASGPATLTGSDDARQDASGSSEPNPDVLTPPYDDYVVRTSGQGLTSGNVSPSDDGPDGPASGLSDASDEADAPGPDEVLTRGQAIRPALDRVFARNGIPAGASVRGRVEAAVAKAEIDRMVADAVAELDALVNPSASASSWIADHAFVDRFVNGVTEPGPEVLVREDGTPLLYKGRVNGIVARRGAGKTWLAIRAAADVIAAGGRVLYFDMEDSMSAWRERMLAIGCDVDTAVREGRVVWVKPDDVPRDEAELDLVVAYAATFDLVVFDVMNRLIVRAGGNVDSGNNEVLWLYDNLFDPIAQRGACIVVLDHPNKRGQHVEATVADLAPGGGAMKMNNASGHVIGMLVDRPFTRESQEGVVRLYCLKDRAGHFEESQCIGVFKGDQVEAVVNGVSLALSITTPPAEEVETLADELAKVMGRIENVLHDHGPLTEGALKERVTRKQRPYMADALIRLEESGRVHKDGPRWFLTPDGPDAPQGSSDASGRQTRDTQEDQQ